MRPTEEVTLGPNTRFVTLPGEKGKGWILRLYEDPDDPPEKKQTSA